jgi:hypothetical protein
MTADDLVRRAMAKWDQNPGQRVGDWYKTKDGRWRCRIGEVGVESIRLADPSARFCLSPDGVVSLRGGLLDHPAIQKSSLEKRQQRKEVSFSSTIPTLAKRYPARRTAGCSKKNNMLLHRSPGVIHVGRLVLHR